MYRHAHARTTRPYAGECTHTPEGNFTPTRGLHAHTQGIYTHPHTPGELHAHTRTACRRTFTPSQVLRTLEDCKTNRHNERSVWPDTPMCVANCVDITLFWLVFVLCHRMATWCSGSSSWKSPDSSSGSFLRRKEALQAEAKQLELFKNCCKKRISHA